MGSNLAQESLDVFNSRWVTNAGGPMSTGGGWGTAH